MVYTSPSLALASVETFVHVDPSLAPSDLVYVVATIPDTIHVSRIDVEALPADWRSIKHPELQKIGDDWVTSGSSLVLEVPSVAVEDEWNILLNPNHPDFSQITIEAPVKWKFDERMFRRS